MKKTITHLLFGIALITAFQSHAQYCGSQQVSYPACGTAANYGFGNVDSFSCITRGQYDSIIIPFRVYQNFTVSPTLHVTIYKLKIDVIDSLPCGLCWSTSQSATSGNGVNEFSPSDYGCIKIAGLTNDAAGSYRLFMTLNVRDQAGTTTGWDVDSIPSDAGGITLWVKVINPGGQCPTTIDTLNPSHPSCVTGIYEISNQPANLSIQPNPVTNEAKVTFTSENGGIQLVRITDIVGREVYHNAIASKQGQNETTISRNKLPAGIYILSVGNEQGTANRKFIIAD